MNDEEISHYIRKRRQSLNLTIEALAKQVGVDPSTIWRWENGKSQAIKKADLIRLAEVLCVPVELLVGLDVKKPVEPPELVIARNKLINRISRINTIKDINNIEKFIKAFINDECL